DSATRTWSAISASSIRRMPSPTQQGRRTRAGAGGWRSRASCRPASSREMPRAASCSRSSAENSVIVGKAAKLSTDKLVANLGEPRRRGVFGRQERRGEERPFDADLGIVPEDADLII